MKKLLALTLIIALLLSGCAANNGENGDETTAQTRVITDILGREVEIPSKVETIAAIGGAARIVTYAGCADRLVGVTDMDKTSTPQMPYSVVNAEHFAQIASVGAGGSSDTNYIEELVTLAPDVIFAMTDIDAVNNVQSKTNIPVVAVYPDGIFVESLYSSITLIGDIMGTQEHCASVVDYIKNCAADLENRTKDIPDEDKPSVYTGAVSFRGAHGFEGTYGKYPPFDAIGAINVVDETGQTGGIIIDLEKVVIWDPDIIFLNPGNMSLVNSDYAVNRSFYDSLTAVQNGEVYTQISYNYNWTNIEIAIADTYYAGKIIFPHAFADIDPVAKADEIFEMMLGQTFYQQLADVGCGFGKITIGE